MSQIEHIHELLQDIEDELANLETITTSEVELAQLPGLCLAVSDVLGYGTAYSSLTSQELGVQSSLLAKFEKARGTLPLHVVKKVANRMRTFLRSMDQLTDADRDAYRAKFHEDLNSTSDSSDGTHLGEREYGLAINAEKWVLVANSSEMQKRIAAVSFMLQEIIAIIEGTNSPPEQWVITELERNQLVAVLETALAVLKSPMVEKGLLKRTRDSLADVARKSTEKQLEQTLGRTIKQGLDNLVDLINHLFS